MKQVVDVLLVDDDLDICLMVQTILKYAGYKVETCMLPAQLDAVLETVSPRMILMDMLLSGTDGRDVCRKLKSSPATRDIKILMMSAHPDADQSCREAGADDFMSKPFDMDFFTGRVKELIAGR